MPEYYSTGYSIWFTHSSVDGHLYCSYFGAMFNNAAMNICIQVFMYTYVSILLRRKLLGHMITICLMPEATAKLFPLFYG